MPKDSQLDPKDIRRKKAGGEGNPTFAQSQSDNGTRNGKKQSGNRHKPGSDK